MQGLNEVATFDVSSNDLHHDDDENSSDVRALLEYNSEMRPSTTRMGRQQHFHACSTAWLLSVCQVKTPHFEYFVSRGVQRSLLKAALMNVPYVQEDARGCTGLQQDAGGWAKDSALALGARAKMATGEHIYHVLLTTSTGAGNNI